MIVVLPPVVIVAETGVRCELVGFAGEVHDEVGGYKHEVRELVALHTEPQLCQLVNYPTEPYWMKRLATCSGHHNLVFGSVR
jgi:hypothetical protein